MSNTADRPIFSVGDVVIWNKDAAPSHERELGPFVVKETLFNVEDDEDGYDESAPVQWVWVADLRTEKLIAAGGRAAQFCSSWFKSADEIVSMASCDCIRSTGLSPCEHDIALYMAGRQTA